jgi:hypothetical protein
MSLVQDRVGRFLSSGWSAIFRRESPSARQNLVREHDRLQASYRAALDDVAELVCRFGPDGTLTFANRAYVRAMDLIEGQWHDARFPYHDWCTPTALGPWILQREVTKAHGGRRMYFWIIRCLAGQQGVGLEYQAVGRDVTLAEFAAANAAWMELSPWQPRSGGIDLAEAVRRETAAYLGPDAGGAGAADRSLPVEIGRGETGHDRDGLFGRAIEFDLRACVGGVVDRVQARSAGEGVGLELVIDPAVPERVVALRSALQVVVTLLVANALLASAPPRVRIAVAKEAVDRLRIQVTDFAATRSGKDWELLAQLFSGHLHDRETQLQGEVQRLALAKRVCAGAGGTLVAALECDRGASFDVVLPVRWLE